MPYILGLELHRALIYSVIFTGIALAIFGAVKGKLTGINMVSNLQSEQHWSAEWRPLRHFIWHRFLANSKGDLHGSLVAARR